MTGDARPHRLQLRRAGPPARDERPTGTGTLRRQGSVRAWRAPGDPPHRTAVPMTPKRRR